MVRLGELGSDTDCPGSDRQSSNDLKEVPRSDTTSVNPATPNNDDRSATEGALEQENAAETKSLDASHPDANGGQSRDSLDLLVENHRDSFTTANSNTAANVALPESIVSTSSVHEEKPPSILDDSCNVHRQTYADEIRRLRRYMPHLKNVCKRSRAHHRIELNCLDFSGGHLVSNGHHKSEPNRLESGKEFIQSFVGNIPSEVDHRVLIVDDLSDRLIYLLGSCLHLTPELFEEHLLNSGWHDHTYRDYEADLWSTWTLAKNYASIKWHRPIGRRVARPYEEQASGDTPLTAPDSWEESISPTRRILHSTEPLVNLLRRPWGASVGYGGFSAWEERATVWKTNVKGCHIGECNVCDREI
ncbi:MAG: hypothetical protein Q9225_004890 [Loekoesia sp. 1 TL-2023]